MKYYQVSKSDTPKMTVSDIKNVKSVRPESSVVSISNNVKYQQHIGIGAAFTEAAAETYSKLSLSAKEKLMSLYFDSGTGSSYNLGRVHMNSCDFSLGNWACQESLDEEFSIERYKKAIFPMIRDAEKSAGKKIPLLISPWSPPAWMKSNGEMNHGGELKSEFRSKWARYYVDFIFALEAEGFEVWGVTVQNEPDALQIWDSCLYSPEDERDFIRDYLGPVFAANGLQKVRIVCWDHNRGHMHLRTKVILSDKEAADYVWGTGFHWYSDSAFDNVQAVHDEFPDKHLIFTEGCQEGGPHHGSWDVAERYATSIINDFNRWTRAWLDWNILLNNSGGPNHVGNLCSAPILASEDGADIIVQPSYYYLNLLSPRFIPNGSVRILSSSSNDKLQIVAFERLDKKTVVIVHNKSQEDIDYHIDVSQGYIEMTIPSRSMQTVII